MPKHAPERYQEIIDWHNAIIQKADKAAANVPSHDDKIAAVNQVLTNELSDLWGGDLSDYARSKIATFSKEMVENPGGVISYKRKAGGELLRKAIKAFNRVGASMGIADADGSFSDFMKHQYNAAKDKGIVPLSKRPDVVPENSEVSEDYEFNFSPPPPKKVEKVDFLSSRGQGPFELPPQIPSVERTGVVKKPAPAVPSSVLLRLRTEEKYRIAASIPPLPAQSIKGSITIENSSGFDNLPKNLPGLPLPGKGSKGRT